MLKKSYDFCDIIRKEKNDVPVFVYRSGLTTYEEEFVSGSLRSFGWNTAGYPADFHNKETHAADFLIDPSVFHIEINGRAADFGYEIESFDTESTEFGLHSALRLKNDTFGIRLTVHTTVDGTGGLVRSLDIENLTDENMCISRAAVFNGVLSVLERDLTYRANVFGTHDSELRGFYSVGSFSDSGWAREGEFSWRPLPIDRLSLDMRYTRSKFRHPLIFLRDNVLGKIWYAQLAHTAGCRFTLDRTGYFGSAKHSVSLTAEIISHNPMLVLSPAESFSLPALHIGAVQGGLDEAVNAMHAHTRKTAMPEADPTGCLVIGSIGELRADTDAEDVKAYAREFAALGAEIFVIDAGWQCPLGRHEHRAFNGTNRTDPARFPRGLAEISDYCHSLGMKFGIWTEIERIGNLSPVYEEHPEWRGVSMYGDRSETYLDMTIPEAAEWAESELSRIIEESRLDLLRIDHVNPGSVHFSMRDRGTGVNECLSLRHYEAVYAMYRRLKKKYPDMIFENCAGGGGRTDLGIMQSFNHTWVSDNQMLPSSVLIGNGMTLALPPERVDRLFGGMFNHYYGSFDAHIRACMLTHMSFITFFELGEGKNPEQYELARHSIELYKSFIRKILPTCRTFHHTPEFLECQRDGLCINEIASEDGGAGALTAIALGLSGRREICIRPRGIDPERKYEITLDNSRAKFEMSGAELMARGVSITLPASFTSELVLYRAI